MRPGSITVDPLDDEDALWEALPDTIPLDPKIIALAETLGEDEFPEI